MAQKCRSIYFTSVNGNKGMLYRVGQNIIDSAEDGDECAEHFKSILGRSAGNWQSNGRMFK